MKLLGFVILIGITLLVSCASVSTSTPAPMPTAIVLAIATATAIPTSTSTVTPMPTASVTPTPTSEATPTPTIVPSPTRINVDVPNFPNVIVNTPLRSLDRKIFPAYGDKRWGAGFDFDSQVGMVAYYDRSLPFQVSDYGRGIIQNIRKGVVAFYPWDAVGRYGPSILEVTMRIDKITFEGLERNGNNKAWFSPFNPCCIEK